MQIELLCIAWSERGETPVGSARQPETLQAFRLNRLSASPRKANPCNGNQLLFIRMYIYKLRQTPNYRIRVCRQSERRLLMPSFLSLLTLFLQIFISLTEVNFVLLTV
ncbi:hypothetical protein C2I17_05135 [Niallia circulans]|nr:hypothetical protein C2I17_05135 [Niallia circulans]